MRNLGVAVAQMACGDERDRNVARAEELVRRAVADGAQLVLLPALFETSYFRKGREAAYAALARPFEGHPLVARMSRLAAELKIVLPVSFYERANNICFSSVAVIDSDGSVLGVYRQSHIGDGPARREKFFFTPGDTGFRIWRTQLGVIGLGLCADKWFPESARAMAVMGAELLLYPTVLGQPPEETGPADVIRWHRVVQGHAATNLMPLLCANRQGLEADGDRSLAFHGSSVIIDEAGTIAAQAGREGDQLLHATFDLDALADKRAESGLFRDRRPDLYLSLLTLDGRDQMI